MDKTSEEYANKLAEEIFKKQFERLMVVNDFNAFKRTHPTLLRCIILSIKDAQQAAIEENNVKGLIEALELAKASLLKRGLTNNDIEVIKINQALEKARSTN